MADIGKAYVQIIPSAQGITGKITEAIGGEATKAGETGGKNIASGIVGALKGALVAAGVGKVISAALTEGGKLQQSYGGLETIYGDAAGAAKKYAAEAVTAGISANDYAEQAVSFGASLKQAFKGDTTKAVEAANTAILDMTDNAAKMGTPLESIQNAYQGFAKGNYTMLDNLKLGYGGTKEEMQRLLADATKLTGVKYDMNNLGDVYSAIHAIQGDLGLTGVAAAEASATFSGSMGAMQAAAANFLGALTTGGDVTGALMTLGQTTMTFITGNLLPMIGEIFKSLPSLLSLAITEGIPAIQTAFGQILTGLSGIVTPENITAGLEIVQSVVNGILDGLPDLLNSGAEMITNLASGISENFPTIMQTATEMITNFLSSVLDRLPEIMTAGQNLLMSIVSGIVSNLPTLLQEGINLVASLASTILEHLPEILQTGVELLGQFIAGLIQKAPDVLTEIGTIVTDVGKKFTETDWGTIGKNIIEGVAKGITNAAKLIKDAALEAAKKAFQAVKDFFGIKSPSRLMRDEVGKMMAEGMAIGFEDNVPTAEIQSALQPMSTVVPDTLGGQYNYGGFAINVYQQPGQSTDELVDMIETRINHRIQSARAVFA